MEQFMVSRGAELGIRNAKLTYCMFRSRAVRLGLLCTLLLFLGGWGFYKFHHSQRKLANQGLIIPGNDETYAAAIARSYQLLVERYVVPVSPKLLYQSATQTIELVQQNWLPEENKLSQQAIDTIVKWQRAALSQKIKDAQTPEDQDQDGQSDSIRAPKRAILSEQQKQEQQQLFATEYQEYNAKGLQQAYEAALEQSRLQGLYSKAFAKQLYTEVLAALCRPLHDPFSDFFQKSDFYQLSDTTKGSFGGVGLYITKQPTFMRESKTQDKPQPSPEPSDYQYLQQHYVKVARLFPGGPSFRAGIMADDFIYAIDDQNAKDWTVEQVQNTVRGIPGSKVKITVLRARQHQIDFEVVREKIEVVAVSADTIPLPALPNEAELATDAPQDSLKRRAQILYVELSQFNAVAGKQFAKLVNQYFWGPKKANATTQTPDVPIAAMILDMRNNPGGLLSVAVDIADQFLNGGLIVTTDARTSDNILEFSAKERITVPHKLPVYVMLNGESASAAEIVAGALQDHRRAKVLGDKSFGKGSVQIPVTLPEGILKLTIAHFYTPEGVNLANNGIQPDKLFRPSLLNKEQQEGLVQLLRDSVISSFVSENHNYTDAEFVTFFEENIKGRYQVDERTAKRVAYNEKRRYMEKLPVYNLVYDEILRKAVDYIAAKLVAEPL